MFSRPLLQLLTAATTLCLQITGAVSVSATGGSFAAIDAYGSAGFTGNLIEGRVDSLALPVNMLLLREGGNSLLQV
jgi:hypothetical protein